MTIRQDPPVLLPPAFILLTESPRIHHRRSHRFRICMHCDFGQSIDNGLSMPRAYHWCLRERQRTFVIWELM